jgi:hypothetical protein
MNILCSTENISKHVLSWCVWNATDKGVSLSSAEMIQHSAGLPCVTQFVFSCAK